MHGIKDTEKATRKETAWEFGVHESTISRWVNRDGCPRNPDGSYTLKKVIAWRIEQETLIPVARDSEEAQKWLAAFRKERAKLARLERLEKEGKYLSSEKIYKEWAARLTVLFGGFDNFVWRLSPLLEGKSKDEISQIMKDEIWLLRKAFVVEGKYTPDCSEFIQKYDREKKDGKTKS
jgi:hypothetical protein